MQSAGSIDESDYDLVVAARLSGAGPSLCVPRRHLDQPTPIRIGLESVSFREREAAPPDGCAGHRPASLSGSSRVAPWADSVPALLRMPDATKLTNSRALWQLV
jgi:hypothetical protein